MTTQDNYSEYVNSMTEGQLKTYIHTVGKAANQRLRELEKQGLQKTSAAYRYIEKLGFDKDYAMGKTGAGQVKFNLRVRGRSFSELRHMVATIEGFMQGKSSTVTGIKDIYKTAYDTYAKNHEGKDYGDRESFKNFAEAMSFTLFRHFEEIYGSTVAIEYANKAQAGGLNDEEVEKALRAAKFTEATTKENAPMLLEVFGKLDEFIANKKEVKANDRDFDENDFL